MDKKYNANSIEVIENLEAVRKRPGMYIGDTNSKGLHHLVREILDNSIDEYLSGFADKIIVTLNIDDSVEVEDNGRGIPIDIHSKTKKPAIETIFTTLHAGGKFGGEKSGYKISGGLHGVGSSVVNALSEFLEVIVWKDKEEYSIKFFNGGKIKEPLTLVGKTWKHGTKIKFKADKKIFATTTIDSQIVYELLEQTAYLNSKLSIIFIDNKNNKKTEFKFKNGLIDYVNLLTKEEEELTPPSLFSVKNDEMNIMFAFKYTTSIEEKIFSFVNNIETKDGGSHEVGFKLAFTKAINDYINENNLQEGGKVLEGSDIREGICAVISIFVVEKYLQFEGQTKSKLSSNKVRMFVDKAIYDNLRHYLNKNNKYALTIVKKAYESKRAKLAARKAREVSRQLIQIKGKSVINKLVPAQSNKAEERELFLVEGDSAGGSAKRGRDNKTQAILSLKGKIINTEKATIKAILENEELLSIIAAIGTGIRGDFDIRGLKYGKIIIMTDADTDGAHIQVLLLTFFYRFMQKLIKLGKVYIAYPPLFKAKDLDSKKQFYIWTNDEMKEIKKKYSKLEIQRYKGLGEMNFEQLWETTMDPETRTLIKVHVSDLDVANKRIETLMGKDVDIRRKWLERNVEFSFDDDFDKE
ncbi:MAG: DNA topoisomerase 4 subunit B [Candidatus Hepatoplasma vulgare]|nr:MAG: DNA topoisomerase 4 subunit B [Candidatus Hepatoplasma sp.]